MVIYCMCVLVVHGKYICHHSNFILAVSECLKITKMARPHRRPMSKRPDCYELICGPYRVVVSTVAFHVIVRVLLPSLGGLKDTKMFHPPPTLKTQYYGEPPRLRSGVLGRRPSGFEFRMLCLEGGVISLNSPSPRGSPGPI